MERALWHFGRIIPTVTVIIFIFSAAVGSCLAVYENYLDQKAIETMLENISSLEEKEEVLLQLEEEQQLKQEDWKKRKTRAKLWFIFGFIIIYLLNNGY